MIHFSNRKIPVALGAVKLSIEQRLDLDDGGDDGGDDPDETAFRKRMQQQQTEKRR